jgi:hypothetical protein
LGKYQEIDEKPYLSVWAVRLKQVLLNFMAGQLNGLGSIPDNIEVLDETKCHYHASGNDLA